MNPDLFSGLPDPPSAGAYARPGLNVPAGPLAASADPATSHAAAQEAIESGRVRRHCEVVLRLVRENPGLTSLELHAHQPVGCDLDRHEIARRCADLKNAGLVRQGAARVCTVGGKSSVTWEIVEGRS